MSIEIVCSETGYKIEMDEKNNIFKVYSMDGKLVDNVSSVLELIQGRYLSAGKEMEIKQKIDEIYAKEINKIEELYYTHQNSDKIFSGLFENGNLVYKFNKVLSKEEEREIKGEIKLILSEELNKLFPVYIKGSKLNIELLVNPLEYLKSFKNIYGKIIREGNYSLKNEALELGLGIDKLYVVGLKITELCEKNN